MPTLQVEDDDEIILVEFAPPERNAAPDAEEFDFLWGKFVETSGLFGGVVASKANSVDDEA